MPTTAWRFAGTEGADAAVMKLQQLDSQGLIDVSDVTVLRWPGYAQSPLVQEHATQSGGKLAATMRRLQHPTVEGSMIETVKGDLMPGTSAIVLLSSDASIDAVVRAFGDQPMELIRSDLSVPQQDQLRHSISEARQRTAGQAPPDAPPS